MTGSRSADAREATRGQGYGRHDLRGREPSSASSPKGCAIDSNLDALEQLGASAKDVIKTRIFLTDLSRWEEAGRAHKETFDEVMPASGFIGVAGFPDPEILVEIEMTAVVVE